MSLTDYQKTLLNFAIANGNALTKKQAVKLIGGHYYCNENKHVGDVLSRMVKAGLLTRIKPGQFVVGKGKAGKKLPQIPNQESLF